jgi:chromosome segregation ATPase
VKVDGPRKRVSIPKGDLESRLNSIARKIADLNTEKSRISGQLSALEKQRDDIVNECKELGVEPSGLDQAILDQESTLVELVDKLEEMLDEIEVKVDATKQGTVE